MRLHVLLLPAAVACFNPAHGATAPSVPNQSFERFDAATGKPAQWHINAKDYSVQSECTPKCVLKVSSTPMSTSITTGAVMHTVEPGEAGGHRLVLSGRIRTEGLSGSAVLWMLTNLPNGTMHKLTNMQARAPTGTTGWQRFEVDLPIPPNVKDITFGTHVSGTGTAWFDDLALTVDDSVRVPAVDIIVPPPRPVASQVLLDDAALAIAASDIPAIKPAWRADIRARRQPIRSLFSGDFSDLQFLKPLMSGKRVVQLGESGHGVAEFNWAKVRLIKFLHQELGYDVIAIESSLQDCYDADRLAGTVEARELLRNCAFQVWDNAEVRELFAYIAATRKTARPLTLAGFDTQYSAMHNPEKGKRLRAMLETLSSPMAPQVAAQDAELRKAFRDLPPQAQERLKAVEQALAGLLKAQRDRLLAGGHAAADIDLEIQAAANRMRFIEHRAAGLSPHTGSEIRDEGMADNLDFLLDTLYPKKKVIVWAHNAHIAWQRPAGKPKNMGAFVAERRKSEVYNVGLYMGRGVAAMNDNAPYRIASPDPVTMEAVLANGGLKYSFVDFSRAKQGPGTEWMFRPVTVREWGTVPGMMTPAGAYDAVLYIDTVTPPDKR